MSLLKSSLGFHKAAFRPLIGNQHSAGNCGVFFVACDPGLIVLDTIFVVAYSQSVRWSFSPFHGKVFRLQLLVMTRFLCVDRYSLRSKMLWRNRQFSC
jgi:hypothetical protein